MAADIDHGVKRRTAAQHLAARLIALAVVQPLLRDRLEGPVALLGDHVPDQGAGHPHRPVLVGPACFEQADRYSGIFRQSVGDGASGAAGTDDDVIKFLMHRSSLQRSALGSEPEIIRLLNVLLFESCWLANRSVRQGLKPAFIRQAAEIGGKQRSNRLGLFRQDRVAGVAELHQRQSITNVPAQSLGVTGRRNRVFRRLHQQHRSRAGTPPRFGRCGLSGSHLLPRGRRIPACQPLRRVVARQPICRSSLRRSQPEMQSGRSLHIPIWQACAPVRSFPASPFLRTAAWQQHHRCAAVPENSEPRCCRGTHHCAARTPRRGPGRRY